MATPPEIAQYLKGKSTEEISRILSEIEAANNRRDQQQEKAQADDQDANESYDYITRKLKEAHSNRDIAANRRWRAALERKDRRAEEYGKSMLEGILASDPERQAKSERLHALELELGYQVRLPIKDIARQREIRAEIDQLRRDLE